jgi:hypothetical protein
MNSFPKKSSGSNLEQKNEFASLKPNLELKGNPHLKEPEKFESQEECPEYTEFSDLDSLIGIRNSGDIDTLAITPSAMITAQKVKLVYHGALSPLVTRQGIDLVACLQYISNQLGTTSGGTHRRIINYCLLCVGKNLEVYLELNAYIHIRSAKALSLTFEGWKIVPTYNRCSFVSKEFKTRMKTLKPQAFLSNVVSSTDVFTEKEMYRIATLRGSYEAFQYYILGNPNSILNYKRVKEALIAFTEDFPQGLPNGMAPDGMVSQKDMGSQKETLIK